MTEASHVPQDLLEHAAFLRRLVRSLLADGHAAEDVVQETWTRSLQRPPSRGGDLRAWLARVARNCVHRERRTLQRRGARERDSARPEELPSAEASLERGETLQRVVEAVRALEEPYRATILARYYEDLPPRAIAAREGIPVETVNTRLKRGLAQLRSALERDRQEWRESLGLLAGESPCLPPHAGEAVVPTLSAKAAIAGAVVLLLGWSLWQEIDPSGTSSSRTALVSTAPGDAEPGAPAGTPAARSSVPTMPRPECALSGRVVDEQGTPVPEARVHVLGSVDPFGDEHAAPRIGWNLYAGRTFACDASGRWQAVLPEPSRVLVVVEENERFECAPDAAGERWVDAPTAGVDFVVRRVPTGTIEVRVVEGAGRVPVNDFWVALHGETGVDTEGRTIYAGYRTQRVSGPVLRSEWPIDDPAGVPLHVLLMEPEVGNLWSELLRQPERLELDIHLLPGETEQVLFVLPERGVLRGEVVDPEGAPVANAFVYFGPWTRARGDEPFKPFRAERIGDGARTAADGWFELRGDGAEVTAGHPNFSSVTVDARRASRIVLGARGALRGRLVDAAGRGLASVLLSLDERRAGLEATTGPDGSFAFERVEAGAHAFWRDERELLAAVRLEPGEEAELELTGATDGRLELALRSDAPIEPGEMRVLLAGFERVFGVYEVEAGSDPATLLVSHAVLPGRYWLVTSTGLGASVTVEPGAERCELELGRAELRVHSEKRVNAQVVPAGCDAFMRLIAARVYVKVEGAAGALFRVHPGRYLLVGEAGAILHEVDVPPGGAVVELR